MPRHRRIIIAGGIYHVIQRGIERRAIFVDKADRLEFLKRLGNGLKTTGSECYGWTLMPNHFHLVLRIGAKPISDLMRRVLTGYVVYFNRRYKRSGHLYQNRYKAIICNEETYLLELVRYVHLNPLRAKLVNGMAELSRYPWCGHSVLMGRQQAEWQNVEAVLERFDASRRAAIMKYESFVADGLAMGKRQDLTGGGLVRSAGGVQNLVAMRRSGERWNSDDRILGDGAFVDTILKLHEDKTIRQERLKRDGWCMEKLVDHVCGLLKISAELLKQRGRENAVTQAKELIVYWGKTELGINGSDIGETLGISRQAAAKLYRKGELYAERNGLKLTS